MKKKVLFTIWSFTAGGGAERVLANIVNNLDYEKYEISILEFANFTIKKEWVRDDIRILEPVIKYKTKSELAETSFWSKVTLQIKSSLYNRMIYYTPSILRKIFIKDKYDIEVAFNYLLPTFLVSNDKESRKFAWFHGSVEDLDYKSDENKKTILESFKKYYFQKQSLNKFENIIAISNRTYNSILKSYPYIEEKLIKIYNGFDFSNIDSKSKDEISIDIKGNLILAAGRLDKNKNFSLLVKAAEILKKDEVEFILIILGEGDERERLESLIRELSLEDNVKLLGFTENPYPYMKKADVFCLTSLSEGFPTVIVEAMTLGCPFVATNVAGIEELSNGGICGIAVDYKADEIAEGIKSLIFDSSLRGRMSKNCIERAKEFSLEKQIQNIEKLFD